LAGIDEQTFWNLTPAEFDRRIWAFRKRSRTQMITLAWHTATFSKTSKLPSLSFLLDPNARRLTPEEQAVKRSEHDELVRQME
jgi:hypothetical protein